MMVSSQELLASASAAAARFQSDKEQVFAAAARAGEESPEADLVSLVGDLEELMESRYRSAERLADTIVRAGDVLAGAVAGNRRVLVSNLDRLREQGRGDATAAQIDNCAAVAARLAENPLSWPGEGEDRFFEDVFGLDLEAAVGPLSPVDMISGEHPATALLDARSRLIEMVQLVDHVALTLRDRMRDAGIEPDAA